MSLDDALPMGQYKRTFLPQRQASRMKLHTWLDEHGKTAAWLAERTGLSASYLSRLIGRNGVAARSPSIETCVKIEEATAGEVTASDFMPERKRKRVRPSGREVSRAA